VTRTGTSTGQSAVGYRTVNGTASAPTDFEAASSSLTFAAGQTSKTITVAVNGDGVVEPDETFSVVLSGPIGATITDGTGVGTIVNDDPDPVASIGDGSVVEGDTGTTTMIFPITLSKPATRALTVTYASSRYNATPGTDYIEKAASVTFASGETRKDVTIAIRGDTLDEGNEAFVVNLVRAYSDVDFADAGAVGIIIDDDP
jgi:chitinase